MSGHPDEVERDLADVRAQIARLSELFSPATMAALDALRASMHEQLGKHHARQPAAPNSRAHVAHRGRRRWTTPSEPGDVHGAVCN
jgi:hypothetical protein